MHPRREPLCGSVRCFPVPVGWLSRGAGRTAYKGVQRAEMLRNVEVFKKYKKKGRRCRLPFVCCVLMLRVPQAVWKAAGAFPVLLPALRR